METARMLLAVKNDVSLGKLKAVLAGSGYQVIDQAKDGSECLRKMRYLKPDLAVMDYDLPPQNGFEVAKIALDDKLCDVILLVNNQQKNTIAYLKSEFDLLVVAKPLNRDYFVGTVDLVIKNRRKIMKLQREIDKLKKTLNERKDIEKAKGLLMKRLNLAEEEAFRRIQKQSMDRGIPMKEIARAIILAYDI
jgi:response regulator NasT